MLNLYFDMLQLVKNIIVNNDDYYTSEKKRGKDPERVREIVALYDSVKILNGNLDLLNKIKNDLSKLFKAIKNNRQILLIPEDIYYDLYLNNDQEGLRGTKFYNKDVMAQCEFESMKELSDFGAKVKALREKLSNIIDDKMKKTEDISESIGNILDKNVPEKDTVDIYTYNTGSEMNYNHDITHVEIMSNLGLECGNKISQISGNRAYVLSGKLFQLKQALINYTLKFAIDKGYEVKNVPVFMKQNSMKNVCQLSDFDETLYEVCDKSRNNTESEQKTFLTATSEQFMVAYHANEVFTTKNLPKRYCAYNECFRKETGRHGKDTLGIFRIHQFDKFEQFVVCDPDESTKEFNRLVEIMKEFYTSLGISYKIIAMDAGDINQSTSIKYDLEAYFPYSKTYRELVSCSNCTDYQAIKVNCKISDKDKFAHMLNSTLCAIQRTLCCLCETYWDNDEKILHIPDVLSSYM